MEKDKEKDIEKFDVRPWSSTFQDRDLVCPKCTRMERNADVGRKICLGKTTGLFRWRKIVCPTNVQHFHWECGRCNATWLEAAKDEEPSGIYLLDREIKKLIKRRIGGFDHDEGKWLTYMYNDIITEDVINS